MPLVFVSLCANKAEVLSGEEARMVLAFFLTAGMVISRLGFSSLLRWLSQSIDDGTCGHNGLSVHLH